MSILDVILTDCCFLCVLFVCHSVGF